MGQSQTKSSEDTSPESLEDSPAPFTGVFQRHAFELKQVLYSLSYNEFIDSIKELNALTSSFSNIQRKALVFQVKKNSDRTIFWRGTVRIKCHKVDSDTGAIETSREMTMKQYIHLYHEIKQKISTLQHATGSNCAAEASVPSPPLDASVIINDLGVVDSNSCGEVDECCICMENRSDVILQCAHSYCEKCINAWSFSHRTCPICRAKVQNSGDAWVLADRPDVSAMAFETTQYLVGLSERSGVKVNSCGVKVKSGGVGVAIPASPSATNSEGAGDLQLQRADTDSS